MLLICKLFMRYALCSSFATLINLSKLVCQSGVDAAAVAAPAASAVATSLYMALGRFVAAAMTEISAAVTVALIILAAEALAAAVLQSLVAPAAIFDSTVRLAIAPTVVPGRLRRRTDSAYDDLLSFKLDLPLTSVVSIKAIAKDGAGSAPSNTFHAEDGGLSTEVETLCV